MITAMPVVTTNQTTNNLYNISPNIIHMAICTEQDILQDAASHIREYLLETGE